MRVKFTRTVSVGSQTLQAGHEANVSNERGETYVSNSWAEEVRPSKEEGGAPKPKRVPKDR